MAHPFEQFLSSFIPVLEKKSRQLNKAHWLLETTGSGDAADLRAELDTEYRLLFHDTDTYSKLVQWDKDSSLKDPLLKRQLNILIRAFKQNQIPKNLLEEIAQRESALMQAYANFRPEVDKKKLSENDIREVLKNENDPALRKKVWDASKKIGEVLAPGILALVDLRNQSAKSLGYPDFFHMQLELQEVDSKWLFSMLDDFAKKSDAAYSQMLEEIEDVLAKRFHVPKEELGPWAWSEPFCQEDPLDSQELDSLVDDVDIVKTSKDFYQRMGIDVQEIFDRSDMYERPGKNQHAFCFNIDRKKDVRTLNNVKSSIKWLETVLHELGHAIYEIGYEENLPWLLREPPHMITTEAMALIAGRQAYRKESLPSLIGSSKAPLLQKADASLRRRQLIFSRWVLVMTYFERDLYKNPSQDLNALWWRYVEQFQKFRAPKRDGKQDWAAKYHMGLAPVYYFSYLLGEMFASSIEEALEKANGSRNLDTQKTGQFLQNKLFSPGNRMHWNDLVQNVTSQPLLPDAWIRQFAGQRIEKHQSSNQ